MTSVRAFATTGRQPMLVDLRFTSLELRWAPESKVAAAPVPVPINDAPQPAANPVTSGPTIWLFVALGGAFLLVFLLAAVILVPLLLRRGASATQPTRSASTLVISFACNSCGKNLKVKANLAGKKVKCPQCSKDGRVPVPASENGNVPAI